MAGELSTQIYTAPQAPDYLGHYAEILRSIPNAGLRFQEAATAEAQRSAAMANYQLMKQKAQAFMELYPAFKSAQIAKLQGEAATLPYRQALLQEQAGLANARAASLLPPPEGTPSPFTGFSLPKAPSSLGSPAPVNPNPPAAPAAPAAAPTTDSGPPVKLFPSAEPVNPFLD